MPFFMNFWNKVNFFCKIHLRKNEAGFKSWRNAWSLASLCSIPEICDLCSKIDIFQKKCVFQPLLKEFQAQWFSLSKCERWKYFPQKNLQTFRSGSGDCFWYVNHQAKLII